MKAIGFADGLPLGFGFILEVAPSPPSSPGRAGGFYKSQRRLASACVFLAMDCNNCRLDARPSLPKIKMIAPQAGGISAAGKRPYRSAPTIQWAATQGVCRKQVGA
jgi:hypothetical protein